VMVPSSFSLAYSLIHIHTVSSFSRQQRGNIASRHSFLANRELLYAVREREGRG
jgi:hypothetical protein